MAPTDPSKDDAAPSHGPQTTVTPVPGPKLVRGPAVPQGPPPTLGEAWGTVKGEDFLNIHNMPCARAGLLTGIGAGAGLGGLHFVVRGAGFVSTNIAIGVFALGSLVQYEVCRSKRIFEKRNMARAVEVMDQRRKEDKERKAAAAAEAEAARQAEERARRSWSAYLSPGSWKFW